MPKSNRKPPAPASRTAAAREQAVEALKEEAERNWAESDRKAARVDSRKKSRDEPGGAKRTAAAVKRRPRG